MKRSLIAIPILLVVQQVNAQEVTYYLEDFAGGPNGWTSNTNLCEGTTGDLIGTYRLINGTFDGQEIAGLEATLSIYTALEYTISFKRSGDSGYSQGQFSVQEGKFISSLTGASFELEGTIDSLEDSGRLLFSSQLNIDQETFDQWGRSLTGADSPNFSRNDNIVKLSSADERTVLDFEKISDCGQSWIWHPDGQLGYGVLLAPVGMSMISESNTNGVMSLNTDWLSTLGDRSNLQGLTAYESELISPSIDLSDVDGPVYLRFNEALAYWISSGSANAPKDQDGLDVSASVSYSIDGGQSWIDSIDVNPDVKYTLFSSDFVDVNFVGTNFNLFPIHTRLLELPGLAGQQEVRIKFNWTGTFYFWAVDDISLQSEPESNMSMGDFIFYPAASYEQPGSLIGLDTMRFAATVSNLGVKDAENVYLRAMVLDPDSNLVFQDSLFIGVLPAGYQDSLLILEGSYTTGEVMDFEGEYTIIYVTGSNSTDVNLSDNYKILSFKASADTYAKEDGDALFGANFSGSGDYQMGNLFQLDSLAGNGWQATAAVYSVFDSQPLSSDPVITTLLYEVSEEVSEDFSNFDFSSNGNGDDLTVIAFGTSLFPSAVGSVTNQEVQIEGILGGSAPLKPGGRYFLVNNYEGSTNTLLHMYDRDISYPVFSAVVFTDDRWFFGFGSGFDEASRNVPVMRMKIRLDPTVALDEKTLPETALHIYPNPTAEQLSVEVDLKENGPGLVIITNAEGKILLWQKYEHLHQETLKFNINAYPPGPYYIRLGTEAGTRTLPFLVVR